jgi:D-alanine--poly(phosphoribitol) ligase subunit 2
MSLSTEEKVLTELEHITGTDQVKKDLDLSLFDESILDSLGTVELMVALSENFSIDISPAEIDRSMWSTPRKIISYIENKINEG